MTVLEVEDRKVAVIGAGASGLAAAELLVRRGAEVILNDRRERDALECDVCWGVKAVWEDLLLDCEPEALPE